MDDAALITCVSPFGQFIRRQGGREYRGLRTRRYTYVRDRDGPWLLYDNDADPRQIENLLNLAKAADVQPRLDALLDRGLAGSNDAFLPAEEYIRRWGYTVDADGTVPYGP